MNVKLVRKGVDTAYHGQPSWACLVNRWRQMNCLYNVYIKKNLFPTIIIWLTIVTGTEERTNLGSGKMLGDQGTYARGMMITRVKGSAENIIMGYAFHFSY